MEAIGELNNLDLLSVGIAIAATGLLGFVAFFNNRKSVSNKFFLLFSLVTIFWGAANYLGYQLIIPDIAFWFLKFTIFFGLLQSFSLFSFIYVFPGEEAKFSRFYKFFVVPVVIVVAALTLTPLVFQNISAVDAGGHIVKITNGPGMVLFAIAVLGLVLSSIFLLVKKTVKAAGLEKKQFSYILAGVVITFMFLMTFNFILPAFFNNPGFIPLGAVFLFPLIGLTTYAIIKHHLLNIKVIATEILTFVLVVTSFIEVVLSGDIAVRIFRSAVSILVLAFGILLIRSVRREVEQREKLEILTKELQSANEKLKELDKLKSEFLSFASHQIKSPMAVVKGFAQLIYDGSYGAVPDKVKETVGRIKEAVDKLITLVNNFLDLRRIEEGKMEYSFEIVDLVPFVKKIVDDLSLLARDKNLVLSFESSVPEIKVKLDVQKFSQVIQNLLDNAIKYTAKGWVKVNVEMAPDRKALIAIADTGRGISAELRAKLFEQFSRDGAIDKSQRGTGLGLFIAKQIVAAHQGEIWAESDGEGKGSRFFVRLPLA